MREGDFVLSLFMYAHTIQLKRQKKMKISDISADFLKFAIGF